MAPQHIEVLNFEGVRMEIGRVNGLADAYMVRCTDAGTSEMVIDNNLQAGFCYRDGHWSFLMGSPPTRID